MKSPHKDKIRRSRIDSGPILLYLTITLGCGLPFMGYTASDYVSEPAGFVRVDVASNESILVSMPFVPFDASIEAVFSSQLKGAATEAEADRILKWSRDAQQYVVSFKADGTGDPGKNGRWFEGGTNWVLSTQTISAGDGFWIQNRHEGQNVFLGGSVVLAGTQSLEFASGFNLFGYPYSSRLLLNESQLAGDGAHGATNENDADRVVDGTGGTNWLLNQEGSLLNGKWLDVTGGLSQAVLKMGSGFWYERSISNELVWTEARPYANLFQVGTNAPHITSVVADGDPQSVALSIACSGASGEILEILYKDLQSADAFESESGWSVAETGIATTGRTSLVWMDSGSATRPGVTGVFCRVYVVGRQDTDSDGDGLSDAREIFVYQTSPTLSDSDRDGLSDGSEVNTYGTDPKNADTDGDSMGMVLRPTGAIRRRTSIHLRLCRGLSLLNSGLWVTSTAKGAG